MCSLYFLHDCSICRAHFPDQKSKTLTGAGQGFCVSIQLFQLRYAIRTDILSAIIDDFLRTLAEHASRLIFAKNNAVAVNIYLERILFSDVERAAHFDRQYDTPKFVDSSYDTGGLHVSIPFALCFFERISPKYLQTLVNNYNFVNIYSTLYHLLGKKSTIICEVRKKFIKSSFITVPTKSE